MSHVVIFEGGAQTLEHVVPEVVVAATYEITDLSRAQGDADRILDSGAATVPSWTLTLDDPAGPSLPDATLIPVGSTAGVTIGEPGIISAADGLREPVTISAISAGAYVRSASLLAGTYASGDTVKGTRITATTTAGLHDFEDALDDQRPLRVLWTYTTVAGVLLVSEPIELRRGNRAAASTGPAVQSLLRGWPELKGRLLEGLTIEALAEFTLEQLVAELSIRGQDDTSIMHGDAGRMLLVAAILDQAARRGYSPGMRAPEAFADDVHEDYQRQLEALSTGLASTQAIALDTEHQSTQRPDPTNRGPVLLAL